MSLSIEEQRKYGLKWLRVHCAINSGNTIFKFANPAGLRPCRICLFTDGVVTDDGIGCCRLCSRRAAGTAEQFPAADAASRYDPLVKMRLERPAGRDKRQYKNKFSAEYPQSEAEGISNRSITKKAVHSLQRMHGFGKSCVTLRCCSRRGSSAASSSCRRTCPQCRTVPPSPARSWPWWGRRSTQRYRRGGGGR